MLYKNRKDTNGYIAPGAATHLHLIFTGSYKDNSGFKKCGTLDNGTKHTTTLTSLTPMHLSQNQKNKRHKGYC